MDTYLRITKALADRHRVRALMALRNGELCVCQIIELLGLAPSTVSKHMSVLKQAGIVDSRKDSRWVYYRLAGPSAHSPATRFIDLTLEVLSEDPVSREDAVAIQRISKLDVDAMCRRQRRRA